MKIFKKLDIIIILFLIILSFVPYLIFAKTLSKDYSSTYANIKVSGDVYDNIPLSFFKGEKTLVVKTNHGNNTISIKDNTIKIIEADCRDDLCIKQGVISKVGQTIVCLPNELIIEIKGDESNSDSDTILSH